jgi:hypothetical protein
VVNEVLYHNADDAVIMRPHAPGFLREKKDDGVVIDKTREHAGPQFETTSCRARGDPVLQK